MKTPPSMDDIQELDRMQVLKTDVTIIHIEPENLNPALQRVRENLEQNKPILKSHVESLLKIEKVETDEQLVNARQMCRLASKPVRQIEEMGRETRRPFIQFNKYVIEAEKEVTKDLCDQIERVEAIADAFEIARAKEAIKLKQQIEKDSQDSIYSAETPEDKILIQISAQAKMQEIPHIEVRKGLEKAVVNDNKAYVHLVSFFISHGGDTEKLKFLADYALKHGKPLIPGLSYTF